ncbi:hypothetical protein U1Q18_028466 [Sarracenia purpurea var. burkii]
MTNPGNSLGPTRQSDRWVQPGNGLASLGPKDRNRADPSPDTSPHEARPTERCKRSPLSRKKRRTQLFQEIVQGIDGDAEQQIGDNRRNEEPRTPLTETTSSNFKGDGRDIKLNPCMDLRSEILRGFRSEIDRENENAVLCIFEDAATLLVDEATGPWRSPSSSAIEEAQRRLKVAKAQ